MKSLTTQMKSFIETFSAQISVLDTNMGLRLNKLENRFLVAFFTVAVCCSSTVVAILVLFQTRAIQTRAAQTRAVQIPAARAPAVGQI